MAISVEGNNRGTIHALVWYCKKEQLYNTAPLEMVPKMALAL
uniref:Uncharacterized protein n=1 Tax=Anguilla anguilla TaxID=7936 RepID=A0A0E9SR57_ANGAN